MISRCKQPCHMGMSAHIVFITVSIRFSMYVILLNKVAKTETKTVEGENLHHFQNFKFLQTEKSS